MIFHNIRINFHQKNFTKHNFHINQLRQQAIRVSHNFTMKICIYKNIPFIFDTPIVSHNNKYLMAKFISHFLAKTETIIEGCYGKIL